LLYFFLSHARDDREDELVTRFFEDLSYDIRLKAARTYDDEVGFLDNDSLEVGAPWSSRLVDALSSCRVLVALCSSIYFSRAGCGKEWTVFMDRMAEHKRMHRTEPPVLLPLNWVPIDHPPTVAARLQRHNNRYGLIYKQFGLRHLMHIDGYKDEYRKFVFELGTQVKNIAHQYAVPAAINVGEFESILPIFPSAVDLDPTLEAGAMPVLGAGGVL
jgi:hypothetical protein